MKISIDTLPLWDAFKQKEICPFCHIENHMEELFIDTYLGESVMEPDTRVEVNAKGFCPEHYTMLFRQKASKLGLALMTHTHLREQMKTINRNIEAVDACCGEGSTFLKRAVGSSSLSSALEEASALSEKSRGSCAVCDRVEAHMLRYHETALHMWEHDGDFRKLFEQANGFCVPHWGRQLSSCKGVLVMKDHIAFIHKLNDIQRKALSELEKDLEWFTRKFDYRNADKPWGNAKDALPRAINTLEGYVVKSEN